MPVEGYGSRRVPDGPRRPLTILMICLDAGLTVTAAAVGFWTGAIMGVVMAAGSIYRLWFAPEHGPDHSRSGLQRLRARRAETASDGDVDR